MKSSSRSSERTGAQILAAVLLVSASSASADNSATIAFQSILLSQEDEVVPGTVFRRAEGQSDPIVEISFGDDPFEYPESKCDDSVVYVFEASLWPYKPGRWQVRCDEADQRRVVFTSRYLTTAELFEMTATDAEGEEYSLVGLVGKPGAESLLIGMGGFLGIGERSVAVPVAEIEFQSNHLILELTRAQLEAMPPFEESAMTAEEKILVPR